MAQRNESYFKSYKEYIKEQGELDNYVESRELAFRFYIDTIKGNNHWKHKEVRDKYGIHCDLFNIITNRPYGLYVLLVYHTLHNFFYRFIEEHPKLEPRSSNGKGDKSMLNHIVGYASDWRQVDKRVMYYDVYHYYRGYRKDYSHPNSSVFEK